jgi:hypothetical protein
MGPSATIIERAAIRLAFGALRAPPCFPADVALEETAREARFAIH